VNDALKLIGFLAICWFLKIHELFDFEAISTWQGYDIATQNLNKVEQYSKDRLGLNQQSQFQQAPVAKLDLEAIKKTCTDNFNFKARIKQKYIDAYLDLRLSGSLSKSILLDTSFADYRFCINKQGGFVFIADTEDNGIIAFLQNRKPMILKASDNKNDSQKKEASPKK
jgi:hypothetical protein